MKTASKLFWRIVAFPFVLCLILIGALRGIAAMAFDWLRYGGELLPHKSDAKFISQVYELVENHFKDKIK